MTAPQADAPYRDPQRPVEERVADLLGRMTLPEKVAQLYCVGRAVELTDILLDEAGNLLPDEMAELFRDGVCQLGRPAQRRSPRATAELTNAIQVFLARQTRLGIPALFNEEGVHGLMASGSTSFPQAIALASTWDEELIEEVYGVVAREARVRGSNYVYAPVLDLARDPRWGRVEETFGEDPYLVSRLGVAAVRGLQGPGPVIDAEHKTGFAKGGPVIDAEHETGFAKGGPVIDAEHVVACAKHYAVHGQPEGGQNAGPASISERVIREEFLPPFQAVVTEAGVQAVMASYNEVDGIPVHANPWLLQTLLREEWGFDGFVTSDGFGVPQLILSHRTAADAGEAARSAIEAGVDCEVPAGICYPSLLDQARAGEVSLQAIDRAVGNLLRAKIRLGLLDEVPRVDPDHAERATNCAEHRELALRAAREAVVLLKNQGDLLPLEAAGIRSMAVIGPNAADLHLGGYAEDPQRGTSVLEGIRQRLGAGVAVGYAEGCRITEGVQGQAAWHRDEVTLSDPADDTPRIAEAVELARRSDVALLVLGGNEGTCREGWWFDHLGDRADLDLLGRQQELAEAVLATATPTVAVLINGRPLTIQRLAETVPAILECWYLGQETGAALADVLFGEVNPSGKLPVSFPRSVGQLPVYYYHKPSAKRGYAFAPHEPLYPFGFGLSYTTFSYTDLCVSPQRIAVGETARVRVTVANSGERAGSEVVQLYVRDQLGSVTRPVKALKGFHRLALSPGESRSVEFELRPDALALLDAEMQWRVEPGLFDVMVGGSSDRLETVTLEVVE